MTNSTKICWTIDKVEAGQNAALLEAMILMPQPLNGVYRCIVIEQPIPDGYLTILRYDDADDEPMFQYSMSVLNSRNEVFCEYNGPVMNFGCGDVGPFKGIHKRTDIKFVRPDDQPSVKSGGAEQEEEAPATVTPREAAQTESNFADVLSKLNEQMIDARNRQVEKEKAKQKKVVIGAMIIGAIIGGAYGYYRYSQQKAAKSVGVDVGTEPTADPVI